MSEMELTAAELFDLRSALQRLEIARLAQRAHRAELKLAEIAVEQAENESLSLQLRLRQSRGFEPDEPVEIHLEQDAARFVKK